MEHLGSSQEQSVSRLPLLLVRHKSKLGSVRANFNCCETNSNNTESRQKCELLLNIFSFKNLRNLKTW